jgi:hypothetical protein
VTLLSGFCWTRAKAVEAPKTPDPIIMKVEGSIVDSVKNNLGVVRVD